MTHKAKSASETQTFMLWFCEKYSSYLYKLAWKYCKDQYTVEDLVQSVWVKLCEKADVLQTLTQERQLAYIATALRNTAISISRVSGIEYTLEAAENIRYNEQDMLTIMMDRKLRIERFRELWPQVPENARELLERKYFLMESDKEIAAAMGIRASSVRTYLTRARRAAYAILAEYKEEFE